MWILLALGVGLGLAAVEFWRPLTRAAGELRKAASHATGVQRVESHRDIVVAAAAETGLDPNLLAAIMMVESRGHVDAVSPKGALGLFQLMQRTADERAALLGLGMVERDELLSDGMLNARLGAHQLAWLLQRYQGDVEQALIAYNAGPGALERLTKAAGGWQAWRDAAEYGGRSGVLRYAREVLEWRERFAERGVIAPRIGPTIPRFERSRPHDFIGPQLPPMEELESADAPGAAH